MESWVRYYRCGVVAMAIVIAISSLFLAADMTQGEVMEEGQIIAAGGEMDINEFYFPYLNTDFTDLLERPEYISYSMDGEVGYYKISTLTSIDDQFYRYRVDAGGGMHAEIEYDIIGEVLAQGDYREGDEHIYERRQLEGKGEFHATNELTIDATFFRGNNTLKEVDIYSRSNYRGKFNGVNASFIHGCGQNISISYHDVDIRIDGYRTLILYFEFIDALDLFNIEGEIGEEVVHETPAYMEGIYEGDLNIRGLPEEEEAKILDEYDVEDFPIRWEDLDTELKGDDPGFIENRRVNIISNFNSSYPMDMELADGMTYDVHPMDFYLRIEGIDEISSLYGNWYYSPDHGLIVAGDIGSTLVATELEQITGQELIRMRPMDEDVARDRMKDLQYIPPMTMIEAILRPPYAYVVMGALTAIALTIYIYRYKKRKSNQ